MDISERTRTALEEFGLTDYEMRAYRTLVEFGDLTASQISEHASIPYSKIYEVLGNLEKKGWIEAEHGRPSRYFPKPPSEAIETTKLRMEGVLKLSESAILDDLQPVYDKKEVRERPDIWIVRGEYNILAKIRETFSNAKKELMIAVPVLPQQAFDLLYPILVRLKEQSVKIAIMAGKDIPRDLQKRMKDIAEVRVREKMFGGGAVSDTREVILLLGEARAGESALAIWSDHIGLAKFAKGYFEFLWATEARKA